MTGMLSTDQGAAVIVHAKVIESVARLTDEEQRARSRAAHPAGSALPSRTGAVHDDEGSLVAEYGLLVVLGATITMLATKWATGGAIWSLFGSVLDRAKVLVGV